MMTTLRNRATEPRVFRELVQKLGRFLAAQTTANLAMQPIEITTGTGVHITSPVIQTPVALVPILRAGLGLLDPFLEILPASYIWHVGMGRDEATLKPKLYLNAIPEKLPFSPNAGVCYVLDTMLATGGTACAVIDLLKASGVKQIVFIGILAAPEGVARLEQAHPDVEILLIALDHHLNEHGFIIPGLGDAGDRQFPKI